MRFRSYVVSILKPAVAGTAMAGLLWAGAAAQSPRALTLPSGHLTVNGSSNVHEWSTTSSSLKLVKAVVTVDLARAGCLDELIKPGAIESFEIAIPVDSLSSGKDGLDKNLQKALNSAKFPDVIFRLGKFEPGANGKFKASGALKIAGVEKDVTLVIDARVANGALTIKGELPLVMTDYGITPPKAMMGMLKTDPKVVIAFDTTFTASAISAALSTR